MDVPARDFPPGDLRVSNADRDRALDELTEAYQVGRITAEEFDERSGQALTARTGKELTALLADLPPGRDPAEDSALRQASRVYAVRIAGAAALATIFTAMAAINALDRGPDLQQREFAQQMAARAGISIPVPPAQGFNWAGTIAPGAIALLLVVVIFYLRAARPVRHKTTDA
jgi:hypothetical protein